MRLIFSCRVASTAIRGKIDFLFITNMSMVSLRELLVSRYKTGKPNIRITLKMLEDIQLEDIFTLIHFVSNRRSKVNIDRSITELITEYNRYDCNDDIILIRVNIDKKITNPDIVFMLYFIACKDVENRPYLEYDSKKFRYNANA